MNLEEMQGGGVTGYLERFGKKEKGENNLI